MPATFLSPISNDQVVDSNGNPLVGGYWQVFLAGTSTPVTTYTDSTGITPQPTSITLDAAGRPANPIWLSGGIPVKFRLFSATAVPLLTVDNVSGINDPAGVTAQDQWVLYGAAPTYISGTSFSVAGDQTGIFQIGRRVRTVNTGGVIYSSITNSVYGAVTTVTVTNDSGTLDAGLSAVSYGLLTSLSMSIPTTIARSGVNTDITSLASPAIAAATATTQARTDISTKVATTAYAQSVSAKIQPLTASIASNAITVTLDPTTLDFRAVSLTSGTTTSIASATAVSLVIASTDSFGLVTAAGNQRLAILAFRHTGVIELAAVALYGGVKIDETGLITTTTTGTTSTSIKSTNVHTNVTYRLVGYVDATFTTAVGWGSLALVQGYGGNACDSIASIGFGQTWQDVSGSRAFGTTYYNNTGKPIFLTVRCNNASQSNYSSIVNSLTVQIIKHLASDAVTSAADVFIPVGASYSVSSSAGSPTNAVWMELR